MSRPRKKPDSIVDARAAKEHEREAQRRAAATALIPIERRVVGNIEAAVICGCCPETLDRRVKSGDGPPRIKLSSRRYGYRIGDLWKWLDDRIERPAEAAS
jgi:predicted DNA-binding transcriptional regulator AlpA